MSQGEIEYNLASKYAVSAGTSSGVQQHQYVSITDIICEGPIQGLVNGTSSIYIGNDRLNRLEVGVKCFSQTAATITLTAGSTSATIKNLENDKGVPNTLPVLNKNYNIYLQARGGAGKGVACQVVTGPNGMHFLILNSSNALSSKWANGFDSLDSQFKEKREQFEAGQITAAQYIAYIQANLNTNFNVNGRPRCFIGSRILDKFTSEVYEGSVMQHKSNSLVTWQAGCPNNPVSMLLEQYPEDQTRYELDVDFNSLISSYGVYNTTTKTMAVVLGSAALVSGIYKFDISSLDSHKNTTTVSPEILNSVDSARAQFTTGNCKQSVFKGDIENGVVTITRSPGGAINLIQSSLMGAGRTQMASNVAKVMGVGTPVTLTGSANVGWALTAEQMKNIDEARIDFSYPSGIFSREEDGRVKRDERALYTMELQLKSPQSSTFDRTGLFLGKTQEELYSLGDNFKTYPFSLEYLQAIDNDASSPSLVYTTLSPSDNPEISHLTRKEISGNQAYKLNPEYLNKYKKCRIVSHSGTPRGKPVQNAINITESIDLSAYKPFDDFRIIIHRITDDKGQGGKENSYMGRGGVQIDWAGKTTAPSQVTTVSAVIREKVFYPYSSLAKVSYSTKQKADIQRMAYHIKGLKISVPSNMLTRDEVGSKQASYNRNVTTGVKENTYQDWDGVLREDLVYCNNPAWVLHDLITNNRYGLGEYIKYSKYSTLSNLDLYAFYRIGRYCDELVTYNGVTEPRFTCNVYLQSPSDAIKVLKDFASVFRASLHWIDAKIYPIMDTPTQAVYAFSAANVIDGAFSYQSFGEPAQTNQYVVVWNNPSKDYAQEHVIVEDSEHIAKNNRINSKQAIAFGCTSEGQAVRYGRWKLYGSQKQREVISFSSGAAVNFLLPGDVIKVQDSARYAKRFSGRISNESSLDVGSKTFSNTVIPLDSSVTLISGNTYKLNLVIIKPAAILKQDTVVNGVSKAAGDIVGTAYVNGSLVSIDTEEKASNAHGDSAETIPLQLNWSNYTKIQSKQVSVPAGGGTVNSLTVTSSFDFTDNAERETYRESLWVLEEFDTNNDIVEGTGKLYQIVSIGEDSDSIFSLSAVEFYNEKFSFIEQPDLEAPLTNTLLDFISADDTVPPVLYANLTIDKDRFGLLEWAPPLYDHINHFNIRVKDKTFIVEAQKNNLTLSPSDIGEQDIVSAVIKVVNHIESSSIGVEATASLINYIASSADTPTRSPGNLPVGGTTNSAFFFVQDTSIARFRDVLWSVQPSVTGATTIRNTGKTESDTASYSQDCSGLPDFTPETVVLDLEVTSFDTEKHFIILDESDTTDRLKLIKYYTNQFNFGNSYWYDTGTGSTTVDQAVTAITGTIEYEVGSTTIIGTGTNFLTDLSAGHLLIFTPTLDTSTLNYSFPSVSAEVTRLVLEIVSIENDTTLEVKSAIRATVSNPDSSRSQPNDALVFPILSASGKSANTVNFYADQAKDTIIAQLYNPE
jgi:hypothetical protein